MGQYGGYPATFTHSGGSLVLNQHSGQRIDSGVSVGTIMPEGSVDPMAVHTMFAAPSFRIDTRDLATVFGTVSPIAGLACTSAQVYFQQRIASGTFAGSSAHVKANSTQGFLYPTTLSVDQDNYANMSLMYVPTYDGTNQPVVLTSGQNLSGTPGFNSAFSLGPVYLGAGPTQAAEVTSWSLDFGLGVQAIRSDGRVYAPQVGIFTRTPSLMLSFLNVALCDSANAAENYIQTLFGEAWDTSILCYMYRMAADQGARASGSAHCKVTVYDGMWHVEDIGVNGAGNSVINVRVTPRYNGTNSIISLVTNSSVP